MDELWEGVLLNIRKGFESTDDRVAEQDGRAAGCTGQFQEAGVANHHEQAKLSGPLQEVFL